MIRKPQQLVVLFALLFAVLIGIQFYFLKNSYALKKNEIFQNVKAKLNNLEDDVDIFDDDLVKDDSSVRRFINLEKGNIQEKDLESTYRRMSEYIQPGLNHYVDSVFASLGYKVSVQKQITSLVSNNTKKELLSQPILVYQTTSAPLKNKQVLSSGRWETSSNSVSSESDKGLDKIVKSHHYAYKVKRITFYEVRNLNTILFRELIILICVSIFILISILILFYKSYQNLLKQSRQIENLHDMVDNVSHEMKTPVATLKMVSRTLEKQGDSEVIRILGRQVDRLEDLLKPLTESTNHDKETIFLKNDLEVFLKDFQFANPAIIIKTDHYLEPGVKIVKQDMETILANLLGNSVKYGATQISVSMQSDDNLLKIIVEDNGSGIAEEDQPYIFEKFYRIQKNNVHQSSGLGLGLYIVRKLLEKYRGNISVESQLNQGTIFQIAIPYEI